MIRIFFLMLVFTGCDSTQRERDRANVSDASVLDGLSSTDADVGTDAMNIPRGDMDLMEPTGDAGAMNLEEDTPEDLCDAEDDDGDGRIDEGIANACGGCGGIPPGGCQHWWIQLVADGDGQLEPRRTVGLAASFLGVSAVDVPNGACLIQRLQNTQGRDDHLGVLTLDRGEGLHTFTPEYDSENSVVVYQNDIVGDWPSLSPGESVLLDTQGGQDIPPFQLEIVGPPSLELEPPEALDDFVEAIRGTTNDVAPRFNWSSRQDEEGIRFYIGGSRVVFRRVSFYQAIEHYVLDGKLTDDGEFILPDAFVGAGIAQASTWIHASRLRTERRVFGPHAVTVQAGNRLEARGRGGMADAEMPPFQIQNPNPNTRDFTPGEPLPIRWSELPDGEGPLVVTLSYRDRELGTQTIVSCTAVDPHLGELILPESMTTEVPDEPGDFRQISVRWNRDNLPLQAPDQGIFTRATSVILNFTR